MAATERNGSQKRASNWFARKMRRLILPILIPLGARSLRHLLAYRVDRDIADPTPPNALSSVIESQMIAGVAAIKQTHEEDVGK